MSDPSHSGKNGDQPSGDGARLPSDRAGLAAKGGFPVSTRANPGALISAAAAPPPAPASSSEALSPAEAAIPAEPPSGVSHEPELPKQKPKAAPQYTPDEIRALLEVNAVRQRGERSAFEKPLPWWRRPFGMTAPPLGIVLFLWSFVSNLQFAILLAAWVVWAIYAFAKSSPAGW